MTDLPLFNQPAPDIQSPPPVAPGSDTSRLAAMALDGPFRKKSLRRIMLALGSASRPLSRGEICERTGLLESSACARLAELRPEWVRAVDGVCVSASGRTCDGYELTELGRKRLAGAA